MIGNLFANKLQTAGKFNNKIAIISLSIIAIGFCSKTIANDTLAKVEYVQSVVVPIQERGANILQVYTDYYHFSKFDTDRPLAVNVVKRLNEQFELFFSALDQSIELIQPLIPKAKIESCNALLSKLDKNLISPIKIKAKDQEIVKYGMKNSFAYLFLSTAQGLSSLAMSERCL